MDEEKTKFKEEFIKRLISFSVHIIQFAEKSKSRSTLWSVTDQLIRSATSIGANVVEAKAASSKRDYLHVEISIFLTEVNKISKILGSSVLTMKGKRNV